MTLSIGELPLPESLERIAALHNANRAQPASLERFRWAYLENPDGQARVWGAEDEGTLVGVAAVFPRRLRLPTGDEALACTTGDLSVAPSHRRRGLASKLRARARAAVDAGESALLFAIPNPEAAGVHERAGFAHLGDMRRMVRVLAIPGPAFVRALTRWPVQRLVRGARGATLACTLVERATADASLSDVQRLYERIAPTLGISVVRSAPYLRWRFLDNPRSPARLLLGRQGSTLRAYAAIVDRARSFYVRDWLADDDDALRGLIAGAVALANAEGKAWLSVSALQDHPHLPILSSCAFRRRHDATAVKVYVPPAAPWRTAAGDARQWFLTGGDPDV